MLVLRARGLALRAGEAALLVRVALLGWIYALLRSRCVARESWFALLVCCCGGLRCAWLELRIWIAGACVARDWFALAAACVAG